jgi:diguanylate cyclase
MMEAHNASPMIGLAAVATLLCSTGAAILAAPQLNQSALAYLGAAIGCLGLLLFLTLRRLREAEQIVAQRALNAERQESQRACVCDADDEAKPREQKQLEHDLSEAIRNNGLGLLFQPIVDATGETMICAEALCRWRHPSRGDVPPATFIPIAEASGQIHMLGEWVLRRACREALNWPGLRVAVNVSPCQFRTPGFVDLVQRILSETGLESARLELELTEGVLVNNLKDTKAKIDKLKVLGVRLALDDFGTGYSSLSYLLSLPFDKLKIDRSFVLKIEAGSSGAAVVHSIVSLGRALGMQVTAEGIESAEQHRFLRIAGVHSFQGYHFGRPVEAHIITDRLAAQAGSLHSSLQSPASLAG